MWHTGPRAFHLTHLLFVTPEPYRPRVYMGLSKIRGSFWTVPIIRIMVSWVYIGVPSIYGNYHMPYSR